MKFEDAATLRRALERYLAVQAGDDPGRLHHARVNVVADRLLARLAAVASDQWALTGGHALDLRLHRRTSRYPRLRIEWLLGYGSEFDCILLEAALCDAGDFFEFEVEVTGGMVTGRSVKRLLTFRASLADEEFGSVQADFAFRYEQVLVDWLDVGSALSFTGIEPVGIPVIKPEVQLAEMLLSYSNDCRRGFDPSRANDLLDIALVADQLNLDATVLREAIDLLFKRENTDPPPSLPDPFAQWAKTFRQMVESEKAPVELTTAASLFDPILRGEVTDGIWHATQRQWIVWPSTSAHHPS